MIIPIKIDSCRTIILDGVYKCFIPGCMGAAVYGERGCTCDKSGIEKSSTWAIEKRIEKLEREIEEVKKELRK